MSKPDYSKYKALYLEDEVLIGMDGEDSLLELGFGDVFLAHSLESAEKFLEAHDVDFALMDVNLGDGRTSLGLAEKLSKKGVKIAFATGYNEAVKFGDQFDAPAIQKPFSFADVSKVVNDLFVA